MVVASALSLAPLAAVMPDAVERLLDRAFGEDRHRRTAYRLRAGTQAIDALSFAALDEQGRLVGSVQCWPVALARDAGGAVPMVMVGPVAVDPEVQRGGIGRRLTRGALDAAAAARSIDGHDALMLIGDPEYYGRFFGFSAERTGQWRLPGPFEPRRLLARGSQVPDAAGAVIPRP